MRYNNPQDDYREYLQMLRDTQHITEWQKLAERLQDMYKHLSYDEACQIVFNWLASLEV